MPSKPEATDRQPGDPRTAAPRRCTPVERQRHFARQPGTFPAHAGPGQIEHYQEMLRPTQGKRHVTATALLQPLPWRGGPGHALPHRSGKPVEPLRSDLRQQFVLADKVAIGGIVRYPGASRHLAQRECAGADLTDQGHCGVEQGLAKIGVMVRLGSGHDLFLTDRC